MPRKYKQDYDENVRPKNKIVSFIVFLAIMIFALNLLIFLPHKTVSYTVQVPYEAQESYYIPIPYQVQEPYIQNVTYQEKDNVKIGDLNYEIVGDRNPKPVRKSKTGFFSKIFGDIYWYVNLDVRNIDNIEGCITVNGNIIEGSKNKQLRKEAQETNCLSSGETGSFDFTYDGGSSDDINFEYTIDSGQYAEQDVTKSKKEQKTRTVTKYRNELRYRTVTKTKPETRYQQVNWIFTDQCFIGCN